MNIFQRIFFHSEENGLLNEFNEITGTVISTVLYRHKFLCLETVEIYIWYG